MMFLKFNIVTGIFFYIISLDLAAHAMETSQNLLKNNFEVESKKTILDTLHRQFVQTSFFGRSSSGHDEGRMVDLFFDCIKNLEHALSIPNEDSMAIEHAFYWYESSGLEDYMVQLARAKKNVRSRFAVGCMYELKYRRGLQLEIVDDEKAKEYYVLAKGYLYAANNGELEGLEKFSALCLYNSLVQNEIKILT